MQQWRGESFTCPVSGVCQCCWGFPSGLFTQEQCTIACQDQGGIKSFITETRTITRTCLPKPEEEAVPEEETPEEVPEEVPEEEAAPGLPRPTGPLAGGLLRAGGRAGFQAFSLEDIIGTVIYAVLNFVGVIFLGLIIYGGFLWMTARGNEQQVEKAKNILERAVIGLVIVLAAYAISYFLISRFM